MGLEHTCIYKSVWEAGKWSSASSDALPGIQTDRETDSFFNTLEAFKFHLRCVDRLHVTTHRGWSREGFMQRELGSEVGGIIANKILLHIHDDSICMLSDSFHAN